jgi:hypothetical protein
MDGGKNLHLACGLMVINNELPEVGMGSFVKKCSL